MKSTSDLIKGNGSYREKLQNPLWADFAKSMRNLRGNSCQLCRQRGVLQVHHWFYDFNREPWEYSPDEVAVLCEDCHHSFHEQLQSFRKFIFGKLSPQAFQVLNGSLAVALDHYDPLLFVYAVAEMASSPGSVNRFANAWSGRSPLPTPAENVQ